MKVSGLYAGRVVKGARVQPFAISLPCSRDKLNSKVATWLIEMAKTGWAPISDFAVRKRKTTDVFDITSLFINVGVEEARKVKVKFVRFGV